MEMAVKRLNLGRSPGPTGIRAEDLRRWFAQRFENPVPWQVVVDLVSHMFLFGKIPTTLGDNILVLLPKNDGSNQHRGIGLLEVIWKLAATIINRRLNTSIDFHDDLHGFCPRRGTGTAILETKLMMQFVQRHASPYYFVFLDISKAYDSLDRARTLQILAAYGVGPCTRRLLSRFWQIQRVVPRQAGFFGEPFAASRGVTQGDVVSPAIFNIVVDAVLHEWHHQLDTDTIGPPKTRAIFYADDGNLHGSDPQHLQQALSLISDLFSRVGLHINPTKTKAMIMTGGAPSRRISDQAYHHRMTGEGESCAARQQHLIACPECDFPVCTAYLPTHRLHQHGIPLSQSRIEHPLLPDALPDLYIVSMPKYKFLIDCPVPTCPGRASDRYGLRRHFAHRHFMDTIIIEEEGALPRCDHCGMYTRLTASHTQSQTCQAGAARFESRRLEIAQRAARHTVFTVHGNPIETVHSFRYLGRMVCSDDNDWLAISTNLKKARAQWSMISRILSRDSANYNIMGYFYKAIVQSVLLYGSETWVPTRRMILMLESFHNQCARSITRRFIRQNADGTWTYPDTASTLEAASLFPITTYIARRRQSILPYATSRSIYRKCFRSSPLASNAHQQVWWRPPTTLVGQAQLAAYDLPEVI